MVAEMKRIEMFFLVMVVAAIFSSCAATNMRMKGEFGQENKVLNLLIEPTDSAGVTETPKLSDGKFACFDVPFPEALKKEQYIPERIKWYVLVLAQGYEYLGQLIKRTSGECELLVDGIAKELENAKGIILSTRAEKVFGFEVDSDGTEISRNSFMSDATYRKEIIQKHGTSLSELKPSKKLVNDIGQWNRFNSPRGFILTPLDEKRFREIISINPGDTYSQRLMNQNWVISTNPVGMIIQNGIVNNINAIAGTPNAEWRSKKSEEKKR